jgi:hypothetical protein
MLKLDAHFTQNRHYVILSEAKNPSSLGQQARLIGKKESLALVPANLRRIVTSLGFFTPRCSVQTCPEPVEGMTWGWPFFLYVNLTLS